ncbi:eCIS core domain-containing protein [Chroococcidiopsis thermalis]|nr:DUF4157 domain-containing protein [Chroococcidiopsis thermalis]
MKRRKIICLSFISVFLFLTILVFQSYKLQVFQFKRCHWLDLSCYPHFRESTTVIAEELWGQAGVVAYQAAARWMYANNGSSQELDDIQKQYLRPYFGDLVDRVAIAYNAKLMDGWLYADFKIDIGQVDAVAQTYCQRIYLEGSYKPRDSRQLALLAHELVHSRQCEQLGGTSQFGYHYFKEYKQAGQNYANNIMEIMANNFENRFAGWVSQQLASERIEPEQKVN